MGISCITVLCLQDEGDNIMEVKIIVIKKTNLKSNPININIKNVVAFNSKLDGRKEADQDKIRRFGLSERNERGQMLMNFDEQQKLYAINTFYCQNQTQIRNRLIIGNYQESFQRYISEQLCRNWK